MEIGVFSIGVAQTGSIRMLSARLPAPPTIWGLRRCGRRSTWSSSPR